MCITASSNWVMREQQDCVEESPEPMKNRLWNANKGNGIVGSIGKWFLVKQPQQKKEVKNSEKYDLSSLRYPRFRIESLKILPQDDASI